MIIFLFIDKCERKKNMEITLGRRDRRENVIKGLQIRIKLSETKSKVAKQENCIQLLRKIIVNISNSSR